LREANTDDLQALALEAGTRLQGRPPGSWYTVAFLAFLLVWYEILMAFMVSIVMPTVGLGCRSFSYLLFGILSSVSWVIQLWKRQSAWSRVLSHGFNSFAILILLVIIAFQVRVLPYFISDLLNETKRLIFP
jgi:hypothetical protein